MVSRDGYQLAWSCYGAFSPTLHEENVKNLIKTLQESETKSSRSFKPRGFYVSAGPKAARTVCLYCFEYRAANISYGIQHLVKSCKSCPQSIKSALSSYALDAKSVRVARGRRAHSSTISSSQKSSYFEPPSNRPDTITQYMDRRLTESQIEQVDRALASWVFSKGLAFNVIL
jgi:hypothetical protein